MKINKGSFFKLLLILIIISVNSLSILCQDLTDEYNFSLSDIYKKNIFIADTIISDTIVRNDYQLIFNSIDSIEYFATLDNYYQFLDYPNIEMNTPRDNDYEKFAIARDGLINYEDSIFNIKLIDSLLQLQKYTPGGVDGMSSLSENKYYGYVSEIGLFVFWESGFEGGGFFAIDRKTGERINIYGFPKYSPNRELILSAYYDVEIGYFINGLQVFYYNDQGGDNKIINYCPDWGFEGAIWKDNSTIYFIRISFNLGKKPDFNRYFMSMEFKKLASH